MISLPNDYVYVHGWGSSFNCHIFCYRSQSVSVSYLLVMWNYSLLFIDPSTFPTLWVGTSLGSVLTIMINVPPPGESRVTQPVIVSPLG
jgi:hypothetical protein